MALARSQGSRKQTRRRLMLGETASLSLSLVNLDVHHGPVPDGLAAAPEALSFEQRASNSRIHELSSVKKLSGAATSLVLVSVLP